jgi:hypothetical protein
MRVMRYLAVVLLIAGTGRLPGAAAVPCEMSDATREALKALDAKDLTGEKNRAARRSVADELAAKYPDDLFIHLRVQQLNRSTVAARDTMVAGYRVLSAAHPHDAFYTYLYARALTDLDTPRAVELLKKIPEFPWSHVGLAQIYSYGKTSDRPQLRKELDAFYVACPASFDNEPLNLMIGSATPEMAAKYLPALLARLQGEEGLKRIGDWEKVWNLEFKARPVTEHPQVRKQVAEDLKRIEPMAKDRQAIGVLRSGYRMAEDKENEKRAGDRIIAEYGDSQDAWSILRERWQKDHPWPQPADPAEQRATYYREEFARSGELAKQRPKQFGYLMDQFSALQQLEDASAAQVTAVGTAMHDALRAGVDFFGMPPFQFQIAKMFVKYGVQLDLVAPLIEEGWAAYRKNYADQPRSDRDPDDRKDDLANSNRMLKTQAAEILFDGARKAKSPEMAQAGRLAIAGMVTADGTNGTSRRGWRPPGRSWRNTKGESWMRCCCIVRQ